MTQDLPNPHSLGLTDPTPKAPGPEDPGPAKSPPPEPHEPGTHGAGQFKDTGQATWDPLNAPTLGLMVTGEPKDPGLMAQDLLESSLPGLKGLTPTTQQDQ